MSVRALKILRLFGGCTAWSSVAIIGLGYGLPALGWSLAVLFGAALAVSAERFIDELERDQ